MMQGRSAPAPAVTVPEEKEITLYPLTNYTITQKSAYHDKINVESRPARLKAEFKTLGLRRSVEAVLVVSKFGFPHVLLLQPGTGHYVLPCEELNKHEKWESAAVRLVQHFFGPEEGKGPRFQCVGLLSTWYRPNFENQMHPYLPAHIEEAKEERRIFLIQMPERCTIYVPRNYRLIDVPICDVYENSKRFSSIIASIPTSLSRFTVINTEERE
eukprot:Clim_evm31s108 gene=Clim_evmTU31s108